MRSSASAMPGTCGVGSHPRPAGHLGDLHGDVHSNVVSMRTCRSTIGVLGVAAVVAVAPTTAQEKADASELIVRAAEQELEDVGAWYEYRFRRHVVRETFDADGAVTDREVLTFQCTPRGDGFDEVLIAHDGRKPSEREIRNNLEAARFSKHLGMALAGSADPGSDESFTALLTGLQLHEWRHHGFEEVRGRQCHRLKMLPSPDSKGAKLEDRLVAAQVGTLWIEKDTLHIVRAKISLSRAVTAYGLIRIEKLEISSELGPVPGDGWLPQEIDLVSEVKVPLKRMRKRNCYRYSEFHKIR
jgi:hypothetical protein